MTTDTPITYSTQLGTDPLIALWGDDVQGCATAMESAVADADLLCELCSGDDALWRVANRLRNAVYAAAAR